MHEVKLGSIIDGAVSRDAVHVAVMPAIAGEELAPGAHVGIVHGTAYVQSASAIGVVDPFLRAAVQKGQVFWLCLYPGSATSLRHAWTHPAVADEAEPPFTTAREASDAYAESDRWLHVYAAKLSPHYTPDDAYESLIDGLLSGEMFACGTELYSLNEMEDAEELRKHAKRVLGRDFDFTKFSFSCHC